MFALEDCETPNILIFEDLSTLRFLRSGLSLAPSLSTVTDLPELLFNAGSGKSPAAFLEAGKGIFRACLFSSGLMRGMTTFAEPFEATALVGFPPYR